MTPTLVAFRGSFEIDFIRVGFLGNSHSMKQSLRDTSVCSVKTRTIMSGKDNLFFL